MKTLVENCMDTENTEARLAAEHIRRLITYAQKTYFRHLRLFDFVLRNSKSSDKKYIKVPLVAPQLGQSLDDAIALDDHSQDQYQDEPVEEANATPNSSAAKQREDVATVDDHMRGSGLERLDEEAEHLDNESSNHGSQKDMGATKAIIDKNADAWASKFDSLLGDEGLLGKK